MISFVSEAARRASLRPGALVYYDTIRCGSVPCKIIRREDSKLWLAVTGHRWGPEYPHGHLFTARANSRVRHRR